MLRAASSLLLGALLAACGDTPVPFQSDLDRQRRIEDLDSAEFSALCADLDRYETYGLLELERRRIGCMIEALDLYLPADDCEDTYDACRAEPGSRPFPYRSMIECNPLYGRDCPARVGLAISCRMDELTRLKSRVFSSLCGGDDLDYDRAFATPRSCLALKDLCPDFVGEPILEPGDD